VNVSLDVPARVSLDVPVRISLDVLASGPLDALLRGSLDTSTHERSPSTPVAASRPSGDDDVVVFFALPALAVGCLTVS
jgi:hypothetical protein